jgi:tRNA pseudouridine38-40 synthase
MNGMGFQRYKLILAYDGTNYWGWQRQKGVPTVQQAVEESVTHLFGRSAHVEGSGRTDRGVHAAGQSAHVDLPPRFDPDRLRKGLNAWLPGDVAVREAEPVEPRFHARFNAVSKYYSYTIYRHPARDPWWRVRSWHWPIPLDLPAMREGAAHLVGRHDFRSFQSEAMEMEDAQGRGSVRTIKRLEVQETYPFLRVEVEADGFLYNMVRAIVGTLMEVGKGKRPSGSVLDVLAARDRRKAGPNAPAHGLCLEQVFY